MTDSANHSSTIDPRDAAGIRIALRLSPDAADYSDAEIEALVHRASDSLNGLVLSLRVAMGGGDGVIAEEFMSGEEGCGIVRTVSGAVIASDWDGESLPDPWDGRPMETVFGFRPDDADTDHVEEQVERAVLGFLNEFAARCGVNEDKVERIAAGNLSSAMGRYVELEAAASGATAPRP